MKHKNNVNNKIVKKINEVEVWKLYKPIKYICSTKDNLGRKKIFEPIMNVTYIYKKYKIDSAQLATSDSYYAKNPQQYHRIHRNVEKRLNSTIDSLNKSNQNKN